MTTTKEQQAWVERVLFKGAGPADPASIPAAPPPPPAASALAAIAATADQTEGLEALAGAAGLSSDAEIERLQVDPSIQLRAVGGALRKAYMDTLACVDAASLASIAATADPNEGLEALAENAGLSTDADRRRLPVEPDIQLGAVGRALRKAYADTLACVDISALSAIAATTEPSAGLETLAGYVGLSSDAEIRRLQNEAPIQLRVVGDALRKAYAALLATVS